MPDLSALMNNVCLVRNHQNGPQDFGGNGVLILPDLLLTSWHIVKGGKDISVTNGEGKTAQLQRGSKLNRKDEELDIAILELSRPLSANIVRLDGAKSCLEKLKGTLMTRYNGQAAQYETGVDATRDGHCMQSPLQDRNTFLSRIKSCPGYSGSPLFDSEGRLCTVLSGSYPDESWANRVGDLYRFLAPPPERVNRFIHRTLENL